MTPLINLAKLWREGLIVLGSLLALTWTVAKPWAQDFVRGSVNDQIISLDAQITTLQTTLHEQDIAGIRVESDLASVKAMLNKLIDLELAKTRLTGQPP